MNRTTYPVELDGSLCRIRRNALRAELRQGNLVGLLVRDRGQLARLFNFRAREVFPAVGLIPADGPAVLARPSIGAEGPFHID